MIHGTLLRYKGTYRDAIPDRESEIFLVVDTDRAGGERR